ncbi:MAG: hypothetical protein WHV63_01295 [Ignavibacteria bacterium]
MKYLKLIFIASAFFFTNVFLFAQEEDVFEDSVQTIEVYLIDNYLKSDNEKVLVLSWMTNLPVKSQVEIEDIGLFNVSDTLTDFHQTRIDLSSYQFKKEEYYFKIISELEDGTKQESEEYSFLVPLEEKITTQSSTTTSTKTSSSYYLYNFVLGMSLWLLPSPAIAIEDGQSKFAILKDFPLVSIGSSSAYKTFPYVYFYAGYLHIPDGFIKNSFRLGTKYLYEISNLKHFVSVGIGGFTNFKGKNGINGEIGFSFLKILRTFELTANYSYNFLPSSKHHFHLFSIGLFTSSFSLNLNY